MVRAWSAPKIVMSALFGAGGPFDIAPLVLLKHGRLREVGHVDCRVRARTLAENRSPDLSDDPINLAINHVADNGLRISAVDRQHDSRCCTRGPADDFIGRTMK